MKKGFKKYESVYALMSNGEARKVYTQNGGKDWFWNYQEESGKTARAKGVLKKNSSGYLTFVLLSKPTNETIKRVGFARFPMPLVKNEKELYREIYARQKNQWRGREFARSLCKE